LDDLSQKIIGKGKAKKLIKKRAEEE